MNEVNELLGELNEAIQELEEEALKNCYVPSLKLFISHSFYGLLYKHHITTFTTNLDSEEPINITILGIKTKISSYLDKDNINFILINEKGSKNLFVNYDENHVIEKAKIVKLLDTLKSEKRWI